MSNAVPRAERWFNGPVRSIRAVVALLAVCVMLAAVAPSAGAHAELVSSCPGNGEFISELPTIRFTFDGPLIVSEDDPAFITIERPSGGPVPELGPVRLVGVNALVAEVLEPIRDGTSARFQRYDWSTGRLGEWAEVRPASTVIVEGVYVSRGELRALFDLVVWVETSTDTRALRQAQRDDSPSWVDRWDAAERHYIERFEPASRADLVVRGEPGCT